MDDGSWAFRRLSPERVSIHWDWPLGPEPARAHGPRRRSGTGRRARNRPGLRERRHPREPSRNGHPDQIEKRILQGPLRKILEIRIQLRIDPARRRRRKIVAAKCHRHLRNLPDRNPMDLHLHQCGDERFLRTLVALEQLGVEHTVPTLRNAKLNLANPRRQITLAIARSAASPPEAGGRSSPNSKGTQTLASACRAMRSSPSRGLAGASKPRFD